MAQDIHGIGRNHGWQGPGKAAPAQAKRGPGHAPGKGAPEEAQRPPREDSVAIGHKKPDEAQKPGVEDGLKAGQAAAAQRLKEAMSNIEDHYNSQIDAIKNSDSYKQALEDLKNGKGVTTTASGSTMYKPASQEGVPDYVIFDGRIFLAAESGGYWAVNSGYGDIPKDVEIKAPKEGEEGYGACDLEKSEPAGRELRAFLKDQAKASDTWREMLKGVSGGGRNWNFTTLRGFVRLQSFSQSTAYGYNSKTGSAFWASQTSYSDMRAWYSYNQKTKAED